MDTLFSCRYNVFQIGFIVLAGLTFVYYSIFVSSNPYYLTPTFLLLESKPILFCFISRDGDGKSPLAGSSSQVEEDLVAAAAALNKASSNTLDFLPPEWMLAYFCLVVVHGVLSQPVLLLLLTLISAFLYVYLFACVVHWLGHVFISILEYRIRNCVVCTIHIFYWNIENSWPCFLFLVLRPGLDLMVYWSTLVILVVYYKQLSLYNFEDGRSFLFLFQIFSGKGNTTFCGYLTKQATRKFNSEKCHKI